MTTRDEPIGSRMLRCRECGEWFNARQAYQEATAGSGALCGKCATKTIEALESGRETIDSINAMVEEHTGKPVVEIAETCSGCRRAWLIKIREGSKTAHEHKRLCVVHGRLTSPDAPACDKRAEGRPDGILEPEAADHSWRALDLEARGKVTAPDEERASRGLRLFVLEIPITAIESEFPADRRTIPVRFQVNATSHLEAVSALGRALDSLIDGF